MVRPLLCICSRLFSLEVWFSVSVVLAVFTVICIIYWGFNEFLSFLSCFRDVSHLIEMFTTRNTPMAGKGWLVGGESSHAVCVVCGSGSTTTYELYLQICLLLASSIGASLGTPVAASGVTSMLDHTLYLLLFV